MKGVDVQETKEEDVCHANTSDARNLKLNLEMFNPSGNVTGNEGSWI